MKIIRTAALVALATAAVSKAKEYARDNPAQASETLDKVEAFVRDKAGPTYSDKVGAGSSALRRSLGLRTGPADATAPSAGTSSGSTTPPRTGDTSTSGFDPAI